MIFKMFYVFSISKQIKYTTDYFISSSKISCMGHMDSKITINRNSLKNYFYYSLFNTNHIILYFLVNYSGKRTHGYETAGKCS